MSSVFEEPETTGFDAFPEEIKEDVEGLMWLGYLEDEFDFCGHTFVLRTLRGEEELLAALVTKEFTETLGQARAWAWGLVSLALVSVDGDEAYCPPVGPDKRAYARARFQYATANWYWPTAEFLYRRYTELLERQKAAVDNLENFVSGSLTPPMPSPGSLTDKGDLTSELPDDPEDPAEILDLLD